MAVVTDYQLPIKQNDELFRLKLNSILADAYLRIGYILVPQQYGAKGDGVTDDTAALQAWVTDAIAKGVPAFAPPGTYLISGNTTAGGVSLNAPDGGKIVLLGAGSQTVFKRKAGTLQDFASLFVISGDTDIEVEMGHFTIDQNQTNMTGGDPTVYTYEHAAAIRFATGTGQPKMIDFHDITAINPFGSDYIWFNIIVQHARVRNIRAVRPLTTVRACTQFSCLPRYVLECSDLDVGKFESEATATGATVAGHKALLSNIACNTFDWAGNSTAPINIEAVNCYATDVANLFRIDGSFTNCAFRGLRRFQRCKVEFHGGKLTVPGTVANAAIAAEMQVWHDVDEAFFVRLFGVTFAYDAGVTSGNYITGLSSTGVQGRFEIHDPEVIGQLTYFAVQDRHYGMWIEGGNCSGSTAAIWAACTGAFTSSLKVGKMQAWTAAAAVNILADASATSSIEMDDSFAEAMQPCTTGSGTNYPTYITSAVVLVDSDPNTRIKGVPGLRAKLKVGATYGAVGWTFGNTTTAGGTAWTVFETVPLIGSATYNPPNIAAGASAQTTVTVTGVAVGDYVEASFSLALAGLTLTGEVSAANTVTATFFNPTAGAIDLASGTLRAIVRAK
jgi:hypothetical protein